MRLSLSLKGFLLLASISQACQATQYLCANDAGQLSQQTQACPAKAAPADYSGAYAALDEQQLGWYQTQIHCIDGLFYEDGYDDNDPERQRLINRRLQGTNLPPYVEAQFNALLAERTSEPEFDESAYRACHRQLANDPEPATGSRVELVSHLRLDDLHSPQGKPVRALSWSYSRASEGLQLLASTADQALFSSGTSFLHAVDLRTGEAQWKRDLHSEISSHAIAAGRLYLADEAYFIQAIDPSSGKTLARFEQQGLASDLSVLGDLLVWIEEDFELVAIDRHSGDERWRVELPGEGYQALRSLDDRLFLLDGQGRVQAFDSNGKSLWQRPMGATGSLFAGSQLYVLDEQQHSLQALATDSGKTLWQFDFQTSQTPYLDADAHRLYLHSSASGGLQAIDLHNRLAQWQVQLGAGLGDSYLHCAANTLFLRSAENELYLLDRRDGSLKGRLASQQELGSFMQSGRYALFSGTSNLLLFEL